MIRRAFCACLAWLVSTAALGHEMSANRLTLVLRDEHHLSMTFYLGYADALHRALAPQRPFKEFLLMYSSMAAPALRKELVRAQSRFERATHLALADGRPLALRNWTWPRVTSVQAALRQRAMQEMVAPGDHPHEVVVEIRAEVTSPQPIDAVALRLPDEFQRVLVVSYRPSQRWLEPNATPTLVEF